MMTNTLDFRLKKVEGDEVWCSNPRLRDTFRKYHAEWKKGHAKKPALFTCVRHGTTHICWTSPTRQLDAYLNKDYIDFEEHDGASIQIWRFTVRVL